jgi:hypothetical protein
MEELLKPIRNTPTDLERLLRAGGVSARLAPTLDPREQDELKASLAGLLRGRTAGTVPELVVAGWLKSHGYQFGGDGRTGHLDLTKDWFFQYPLEGGRSLSGGGAVADVFLSPRLIPGSRGGVIRVNGYYWHTRPGGLAHDAGQKLRLEASKYKVYDLWDYQALNPGTLDGFFTGILGSGNRA